MRKHLYDKSNVIKPDDEIAKELNAFIRRLIPLINA